MDIDKDSDQNLDFSLIGHTSMGFTGGKFVHLPKVPKSYELPLTNKTMFNSFLFPIKMFDTGAKMNHFIKTGLLILITYI